ncbi:MAG: hypothetical protein ACW97A_14175 [Candidatus Thorarchaeota archaeon]|jgi:hypothetical protein
MTILTVEQLEKWYRKRLSAKSKDFIKQAEKSYKIVDRALRDVEVLSQDFIEESMEDDTESSGTSSRFAMKISEIVEDFDIKQDITYASAEAMQEEIQRFIQELWGAGARWIRRMDKKHKAKIKSLDTYMKELANEMKKLGKLLYEYSWIKDLERIGLRIGTLRDLTFGRELFEEQIRQTRLKIEHAQSEYDRAKTTYNDFVETSNVSELLNLDEESERVASLLRMKLNTLKKPVKKFLQRDTGVRISPAGQIALTEYFEDPLSAIVAEPDGLPGLIEGLKGIQESIETGRLKLKDRLARRSIEEIEAITNGSLGGLEKRAKDLDEKKREYAGSDVYTKSANLSVVLNEASKNLEYHTNDLLKIGDDIRKQIVKVEEFRTRIESEILEAFTERVVIKVEDLQLEPLLEKCMIS